MRTFFKALAPLVVVALAVTAVVLFWPGEPRNRVTAYFANAVGLYAGADVRILGIPVGEVESVTPAGTSVKVVLNYASKYKVPANGKAVVVSQSLVSDRFVQLTPVYKSGPAMADGGTYPLGQTDVPVEVDQVAASLNELSLALGPDGANADGSLSRLLEVTANNLDGTGADLRDTFDDSAKVLSTLSENREDITATIQNLEGVTSALAENDDAVRRFTQNLSDVSVQLNGEKEELSQALKILAPTLDNVTKFVKDNREALSDDVHDLAEVTAILVERQDELGEFLETAPIGISNMTRAYDPISGTLHTRTNFRMLKNPADWICSLAYSLGTPADECLDTLAPISGGLPIDLSLDISWITAMTTTYNPEPLPPDAYGPNGKPGKSDSGKQGKDGKGKDGKGLDNGVSTSTDPTLGGLLLGGSN
ncbi:phospholipid/cholesterol/gamma-HCH transport system substrate-binding protein [Actinocorallia herbida]|uniref:Phospholipid/cholesterol/gamma-HCH transport system substrate-binding protein n=1 Tax=Actinocorallia herbida TaxID=58109 RepID=A0A3N1DCF7_9ACTN|nr:MCE family protein [Actinocorallia herbida]ROO91190.1 phospholipid/cholesterol/gamma-HCH transport system substrate-binding protein [Actinocorallia herbida]